ncbi:MAG: MFS transporter [Candidatus Cloacimonetes bacterium]|nr:MFS transporter [Candidatus Cloacimonadota bacterium]
MIPKDKQLFKFSAYGFLKNLRFFDAFIILFFRQQGISFLQIGTLVSIREISIAILEIPTGIIADSYGRRSSMIFSFLSYIISFLIFFFFPKFSFYIVAMIFFAMGEAFRTGTHKAMILEYLNIKNIKHLKVEYYGFTRSWSQKGSALAALIAGGIVLFSGNYKYIFIGSIVPYILALFLMISYPKELDGITKKDSHPNFLKAIWINLSNTTREFINVFKDPLLRRSIINSSLFDGLFKTVKDYIQPIIKAFAISAPFLIFMSEKRDTVMISIVYFVLFFLSSIASRNSEKFKNKFDSLAGAINKSYILGILFVIASGLFYICGLKLITIICFIIFYMFQNLRRPMNVGYISGIIPSGIMASGLSAESQLKTFFIAVLSPVTGYLADTFGIGVAIIILSFLTLSAFPLIRVRKLEGKL